MDGPLKILKFGKKEIYLPKFTIALIRTPRLSPYHAKFQVPLSFSKYDLRDYLFHAYNVRAVSIRSAVVQQPLRDHFDAPRQWFRPESKKYMTIEMDKPFVWPKEPESWEPWGKDQKPVDIENSVDMATTEKTHEKQRKKDNALREQAARLLRGDGRRGQADALQDWEQRRTNTFVETKEQGYKIRV